MQTKGETNPNSQMATRKDSNQILEVNINRVLGNATRYWYWLILSVVISVLIAFAINRYSTRVFPVTASVMVKENQEMSEAEFIIKNALVSNYKNYYNELYIIKSYPLIERVIRNLNFQVSFFREGNIKTTEIFDSERSFDFFIIDSDTMPFGKSFTFEFISKREFKLGTLAEDELDKTEGVYKVGDTINFNSHLFYTRVNNRDGLSKWINTPYLIKFQDPAKLSYSYSQKLGAVWAEEGASVVNLSLTGSNPKKEAAFLNEFILQYQQNDIDRKNQVASKSLEFLDEQLKFIGDSLRYFEEQIERFKQANVITTLDAEAQRLYQKLELLESQKVQQVLTENYFQYVIERLKTEKFNGIITPESVGISDPVIVKLITELIEVQAELTLFDGVERMSENPIIKNKKRRIGQIKDQIINAIQTSRDARNLDEEYLDEQIKNLETQLSRLPGTERALVNIQRNYKLRENLYVFLLEKRAEIGITKASATSSISIINKPVIGNPISPKPTFNYLLAVSLGVALPITILILIELTNRKIQSKDDILALTNLSVIAAIGHKKEGGNLIVHDKPRSAMAEGFRGLRSNLNYFTSDHLQKIFLITSSISGEGKTFTTLNLATVLALSGKKTLIIGADLRRPKLFDDLDISNQTGLSQFLSNMANLEGIVQSTFIDNLFLIPGGPVPPNPSELLLKKEMRTLLEKLKTKYDYILIDTPPIGLVSDALVLNEYADHTLYVVRQNYTPKSAISALDEIYTTGQVNNISILFNDIRINAPGYGYSYGYGYGYGNGYGYGVKESGGYYTD